MHTPRRILVPVVILAGCGGLAWWLHAHRPVPDLTEKPPVLVKVEGITLKKTSHTVIVRSEGTVQPRTRSILLPEVPGKIVEIGASFRPGGFFEKDEALLTLDRVDYEVALVVAEAAVADAEAVLAEERAKAEQAGENWRALGGPGEASDLALRRPQLAKSEADAASARAQVRKAARDLERTVIRAPYAGQVLEQSADVGQYVTTGTPLGKIFAVDHVEVRLPLPEREARHLELPEHFRGNVSAQTHAPVALKAVVSGRAYSWNGRVIRQEGALDDETRQIVAVAQVDDPYGAKEDGRPPLRIGQFVEAEITGASLQDVFVIPRRAVRAGNEVILITPENTLQRVAVEPVAGDENSVIVPATVNGVPKEGDRLCLTPIPFPADGARVLPVIDGRKADKPGVAAAKAPDKPRAAAFP